MGGKIYIAVIVIMLPGMILFHLFNIPFIPSISHLDPFNGFVVDNWLMISIVSIVTSIITVVILRIVGDEILDFGKRVKIIYGGEDIMLTILLLRSLGSYFLGMISKYLRWLVWRIWLHLIWMLLIGLLRIGGMEELVRDAL